MPDERDRYPVNPLDGPSQMADRLAEIERRLAQLEGAPPVGVSRLVVPFPPDAPVDPDVYQIFYVDQTVGVKYPWQPLPMRDVNSAVTVTSATFVPVFRGIAELVSHRDFLIRLPYATDVGTSLELKVVAGGVGESDPHTVTGTGEARLLWSHGIPIGFGGLAIDVYARRSAGSGAASLYETQSAVFGYFTDATTDGAWS